MFWKLHFTVYSNFKIEKGSNALTKLRSENFWKLRRAIINTPMRLQLNICHKKELLSLIFFFSNTCANTQQVLPVQTGCTGRMNEWCEKLAMKALT